MDMKTIHTTLKYIKVTSIVMFSLYALTPFINGLGCDFKTEARYDQITYLNSCKFGQVKSLGWNKKTGEKIYYSGILAKKNNDIIFFVLESKELSKPTLLNEKDMVNISITDASIFSAKQIHAKEYDLVMVRNPSFFIYKANTVGKLGFW